MENHNFWVKEYSFCTTMYLMYCIAIVLIGPLDADQGYEELDAS